MAELRQRKPPQMQSESSSKTSAPAPAPDAHDAPPAESGLSRYFEKAIPVFQKGVELIEHAAPYAIRAQQSVAALWVILEPYQLEDLLPAFIGLIMCFFGGSYLTLIAAVEAYRMTGWESTKEYLRDLSEDIQAALEASRKDDQEDLDGDGIADVKQITSKQLLHRKIGVFLRSVDPARLSRALAGLNAGFFAVLATLKIQFAKAITLGNAIADVLDKYVSKIVTPALEMALPAEYKKWAHPVVTYTLKCIAISIAWFVQRVISAFHSAIRGGLMFSRNILAYLVKRGLVPHIDDKDTYADEVVGGLLAALGFYFQLSYGFSVPFPLNLLLFPFTLCEWFLMWMVNAKV